MKRYRWYTILLLILFLILQPFTAGWFQVAGIRPDLLLPMFIFTSFARDAASPVAMGIGMGLAADFLYSRWIGPYILIYFLTALLCRFLAKHIFMENVLAVAGSTFLTVYVMRNIYLFLIQGSHYLSGFVTFQEMILGHALYAGILCGLMSSVYLLFRVFTNRTIRIGRR